MAMQYNGWPPLVWEIVMKNKFIALVLACGLPYTLAYAAPKITMHCINPGLTPKFVDVKNNLAVTETVQVNIGIEAGPGTVWANHQNDAICRAKIGNGYRITSGSAVRDDGNSAGFDGMDIRAKNQALTFFPHREGDELVFTLYSTSPNIKGTANFKFYITYAK
jgi:hypothetical protein